MSSFDLTQKVKVTNPCASIDWYYGGDNGYWSNLQAAKDGVPIDVRVLGKTILVNVPKQETPNVPNVVEYWWKDGVTDNDLVEKMIGGGEPKPYELPTINSFTASNSGEKEENAVITSSTLSVNISKGSTNITRIRFYVNNNIVDTKTENVSSGGTFSYTYRPIDGIITNTDFYVDVTDSNDCIVKSDTVSVTFNHYVYVKPKTSATMSAPTTSSQIKSMPTKSFYSTSVDITEQQLRFGAFICCKDGFEPMVRTNYSDNLVFTRGSSINDLIPYEVGNKKIPYTVWTTTSAVNNVSTYNNIRFKTCNAYYKSPSISTAFGLNSYLISPNITYGVQSITTFSNWKFGSYPLDSLAIEENKFQFKWSDFVETVNSGYIEPYGTAITCSYTNIYESKDLAYSDVPYLAFATSPTEITGTSNIRQYIEDNGTKVMQFNPLTFQEINRFNYWTEDPYLYVKLYNSINNPPTISILRGQSESITGSRVLSNIYSFYMGTAAYKLISISF